MDIRFPPNAATSEADREAQVLYLASDLSDLDPRRLREAAKEWVRTRSFMPKAAELRALCRSIGAPQTHNERTDVGLRVVRAYNARLAGEGKSIRWVYNRHADSMRLVEAYDFNDDVE